MTSSHCISVTLVQHRRTDDAGIVDEDIDALESLRVSQLTIAST